MAKPFVTVLIDTYNHERFIEQAIVSVLEQDFPLEEMEILVVDDGSTDATPDIVRKFEPRVQLLCKANGGQASAFNAVAPKAQGSIISFLDGDDWWAPKKLTLVVEALRNNPAVGMVGHGITEIFPDGRQHTEILCEVPRFRANSLEGARTFRIRKSFLGTSRMTLRADLARQILPVPEALQFEADEYIFTLAAVFADVLILQEALTFYRLHGANLFLLTADDEEGIRRKQRVLAALVKALAEQFDRVGLSKKIARAVTDVVQAEADQLRLWEEGGWPWETVKAEWLLYRVLNERAPVAHRIFKYLTLAPALLLPPRFFYRVQRAVTRNRAYLLAREKWLPIPQPAHVARSWKTRS
jgi:glycosyltransferase involved in cell wall biosynthesis